MLEKETTIETKKIGILTRVIIVLAVIAVGLLTAVVIMRIVGKQKLKDNLVENEALDVGEETSETNSNQIIYKGKTYDLNEDIVSVLVMGIDTETVDEVGGQSWKEESKELSGGQADTLFLMIINPHKEDISIIAINRNTMADVDVWDKDGNYTGVFKKQIALQHGYGDGGEESCLRQVKAVSRLLYNIPINSYAAISMDGVPKLNDAVGGIKVEVLDDIVYPEYDMNLHKGDKVNLKGKSAYWYVRLRNENQFNSNELRQNRQKQYLMAFIEKAKSKCTSDIRVAGDLYTLLSKYMVTDVDVNAFTYMATEYRNYSINTDKIYSLKGETLQGNKFEEFYMDEDSTKQLIVDLFYEPVD